MNHGITFTDIFCGAGGSSIGLTGAGFDLKLAANHWDRAIATHAYNFTAADHLCADVSNYDMRRLPRTDVLWASPECTWHSPAGGRKRVRAQLDLFEEYVPTDGGVRSRATAFDVIRATEVHRYRYVVVENVVEFADWPLFQWWLDGMVALGYSAQILCLNSAHAGDEDNPWAPQWRDRIYVGFTRDGMPVPDLTPRPLAWCPTCDLDVQAVQVWKNPKKRPIGKYRQQYVYRCPMSSCRHELVEPYVLPAAAAIDWSDLGTRIGDRARPLAAATMRRIRAGLDLFAAPAVVTAGGNTWERPGSDYVRAWPAATAPLNARTGTPGDAVATPPFFVDRRDYDGPDGSRVKPVAEPMGTVTSTGRAVRTLVTPPGALVPAGGTWNDDPTALDQPMRTRTAREAEGVLTAPVVVTVNHDGDGRAIPATGAPLASRTTKIGEGVVMPEPFVTMLRGPANRPTAVSDPLATVSTGNNHYLTAPEPFVTMLRRNGTSAPAAAAPLATLAAGGNHHALVIPYRRKSLPKTTGEPLHTVSTHDSAGLLKPAIDVEDCHFRMLQPREHLRAQRFPDSYTVLGNRSEQTMQAGNAVSSNVAQWIGTRIRAAMERAS